MLNIFITNLGKYNEGSLIGEWLELPATEEQIQEVLNKIGINEEYEEYFITDNECEIKGIEIGEYSSISELNEIAEILENIDAYDYDRIEALLELGYISQEDILKDNYDLEEYNFLYLDEDISDGDTALGYALVEGTELEDQLNKLNIESYFDYEAYGRDARYSGWSIASNNIAIFG